MTLTRWLRAAFLTALASALGAHDATAQPFAYITQYTGGTVSVIDTVSNAIVAIIPVGLRPFGAAVNPNGTRVYVTNETTNDVSVIDATTNAVVATISVGVNPHGVAVNRSGNGNGRIYTIRVECRDGSGNSSSRAVAVAVPRNQAK